MADTLLPSLNELLSADLSRVRYALHAAGIRRGTPAEGVRELAAGRDYFRDVTAHVRKLLHAACEQREELRVTLDAERAELVKDRDWALGELDKARAEALHARGGWLEANHRRDEAIRERDAIREDLAKHVSQPNDTVMTETVRRERDSALELLAETRALLAACEHTREREALSRAVDDDSAYMAHFGYDLASGPDAVHEIASRLNREAADWPGCSVRIPCGVLRGL